MSGGGSLHKKDWAKVAGLLALGTTGAGAAGYGPLAGLLGGASGAGGAAAGAGAVAGDAYLPGALSATYVPTGGAGSATLQAFGGMGSQQADILAAQNVGFGAPGAVDTLSAANPASFTVTDPVDGSLSTVANPRTGASGLFNAASRLGSKGGVGNALKTLQFGMFARGILGGQQPAQVAMPRGAPSIPQIPGVGTPYGNQPYASAPQITPQQFALLSDDEKRRLLQGSMV